MLWVTREGAKVDRLACPWLIRRFIDPEAEFLFVPAEKVNAIAREMGATPFDAPGVELGHHGNMCSFETIIQKYDIADTALARLAAIVHGADIPADITITPESAGLNAVSEGLSQIYASDQDKLEVAFPLYNALYAYCQAQSTK